MEPYYEDGFTTIYHGDCREIVPTLAADVLITDPPWGVGFKGKWTKHTLPAGGYEAGEDDPSIGPQVVSMALGLVLRGAVFSGQRLIYDYPRPQDIGGVYLPSGSGFGPWGFQCFNPVLFYGKRPGSANYPTVFTSFDTADKCGHPCPKPMRWMTWAVSMASLEGECILDPFAGSGTTLRAAKDMGRRAIGIELVESYCEMAATRLSQGVLDFGGVA